MSNDLEASKTPIAQDALPSILDLNDNCLLEIICNLDAVDLSAISETCQRFRPLSEYCVSREFSVYKIDVNNSARDSK